MPRVKSQLSHSLCMSFSSRHFIEYSVLIVRKVKIWMNRRKSFMSGDSCYLSDSPTLQTKDQGGWSKFRQKTEPKSTVEARFSLSWLVIHHNLKRYVGANEVGPVIKHNTCPSQFERHRCERRNEVSKLLITFSRSDMESLLVKSQFS